jgi:serine/threonine-protein kinase HipA
MNPNRDKRQHALTWDGKSAEPDIEALKQTAPFYQITHPEDAQLIISEVTAVVTTCAERAQALQIPGIEVQAMKSVFAV